MRFRFIDAEKASYPVVVLCRVLEVWPSGYYAWRRRPEPIRARKDAQLAVEIAAEHKRSRGIYGSPRVHRELRARGVRVGRKRVERLMRKNGLQGRQKRRFRRTTDSKHGQPIAPNVLGRQFDPKRPNEAWATDVTYVATSQGWLYLAILLDLFSRRVVGWAISDTNDRALALQALNQALRLRHPPRGLVHHSDRGSPYASDDYRTALATAGLVASMSRTGDCWDNAVAESFFATLRAELLDHERYETHADAAAAIGDYIDGFYNPQRRHSYLGYVSPIEYELRAQVAALAA
jgi:transposase InsO family protein